MEAKLLAALAVQGPSKALVEHAAAIVKLEPFALAIDAASKRAAKR